MLFLKAAHIISVVCWFAGLFYIVRLFIYHVEANQKPSPEKEILQTQFSLMERRLWYGITWPACVLTLITGIGMASYYFPLSAHPWLLIKLFFVLMLFFYHLWCGKIYQQLMSSTCHYPSFQLRLLNELATVFLFIIVFVVTFKNTLKLSSLLIGVLLFTAVIYISLRWYNRKKN